MVCLLPDKLMITGGEADDLARYQPLLKSNARSQQPKTEEGAKKDEKLDIPEDVEPEEKWLDDLLSLPPSPRPTTQRDWCRKFVMSNNFVGEHDKLEAEWVKKGNKTQMPVSPHLTVLFLVYCLVKLMGSTFECLCDQGK